MPNAHSFTAEGSNAAYVESEFLQSGYTDRPCRVAGDVSPPDGVAILVGTVETETCYLHRDLVGGWQGPGDSE